MSIGRRDRRGWLAALLLAAACVGVFHTHGYTDFERLRFRVVTDRRPADGGHLTVVLPDLERLAGQPAALILRLANEAAAPRSVRVSAGGEALGQAALAPGDEARFDLSVPDGAALAAAGRVELDGDGGGWALTYLEAANVHGFNSGWFELLITPAAARPSQRPTLPASIALFALLAALGARQGGIERRWGRLAHRAASGLVLALFAAVLAAPLVSPFALHLAAHNLALCFAVLYAPTLAAAARAVLPAGDAFGLDRAAADVPGAADAADAADAARADTVFFRAFDLLAVWVVCVSWVSIALLALDAFDAAVAVVGGALLTVTAACFGPARLDRGRPRSARPVLPVLLLVLLAALLFRMHPFRTLYGGQDQGVYVAMSSHLQREGSVFFDDSLPDALPDERSREIYLARVPSQPAFEASSQPGVYHSHSRGDYVFQFYHLSATWMAAFADLLGDGARFHAVTFFGLLSILGLCLLTLELTGSRTAVLAAGLLLAVNPLHAFFSRMPLTEVFALALLSIGVYYLARALRGMRTAAPARATAALLALSCGSVALVFFTRITGFLYLPALVPIFGLGVWSIDHGWIRGRQLMAWAAALAALYGVSVLYGLSYSPVYVLAVYDRTFGAVLGEQWPVVSLGAAGLATAGLAALAAHRHRAPVRALLERAADARVWTWLATTLALAAVAGSLLQAWWVGFGSAAPEGLGVGRNLEHFGLVGSGAGIFLQSGAAGWLMYASPLLVVVLVWGMHRRDRPAAAAPLYFFLSACLAANLLLNIPIIYYHYYYARYLLSEVVPYTIVLAVALTACAGPGVFRRLGLLAIAATAPFHLYYAALQAPVREGQESYAVLTRVAERVGDGVVLLEAGGFGVPRFQTPLDLYFGANVFPYAPQDLDAIVSSFEGALERELWLLDTRLTVHDGLQLAERLPYPYEYMAPTPTIPAHTITDTRTLYLYRMPGSCETPGCDLRLEAGRLYAMNQRYVYPWKLLGPGWYGPEERQVWSGREAVLKLSRTWFASGRWPSALLLEMRAYGAAADHRVTLTGASGGAGRVIHFDDEATRLHELPLDCPQAQGECAVQLTIDGARSPRERHGTRDGRTLGVSLLRIGFAFGGMDG